MEEEEDDDDTTCSKRHKRWSENLNQLKIRQRLDETRMFFGRFDTTPRFLDESDNTYSTKRSD